MIEYTCMYLSHAESENWSHQLTPANLDFQQLILDLQRRCADAEARIANLCLYTQSLQVLLHNRVMCAVLA